MGNIKYDKFSEYVLAFMVAFWGLWLLLPFDTYSSSLVFSLMASLVSENLAGILMAIFGGIWLSLALTGNQFRLRRYIVLIVIFLWSTITVVYIMGSYNSTATVVNSAILLLLTKLYSDIIVQIKWDNHNGNN